MFLKPHQNNKLIRQNLKIPKVLQFYFSTHLTRLGLLNYLKMTDKNVNNNQQLSKSLVGPYKSIHDFNLL